MTESKPHVMWFDPHAEHGPGVFCTCGQSRSHHRLKVLTTWALKHHNKTNHELPKEMQ